jgi:hypothetical protein
MALSDYEHLIIGPDGKTTSEIKIGDTIITPYKNWLYIGNKKIWNQFEKCGYVEPIIAQINGTSTITLFDFTIETKYISFNEKHGIVFFIRHSFQDEEKQYKTLKWSGILTSGYEPTILTEDLLKLIKEKYGKTIDGEFSIHSVSGNGINKSKVLNPEKLKNDELNRWFEIYPFHEDGSYDIENNLIYIVEGELHKWTGITDKEIQALKDFINEEDYQNDYINTIQWDELKKWNQGDKFFEENLNLEDVSTNLNESTTPIIQDLIKNI